MQPDKHTNRLIKHFRNGSQIDMNRKTNEFNSYMEWRKASNYSSSQNRKFVELISSNSSQYDYDYCLEKLNECINAAIPPNDLIIALLYLSCHHFSPHAMGIVKHLLINYSAQIDLRSSSISPPQFKIPHIAAMNGDIELLQIYFNLNGDINVVDGRNVLPITVSIAERYLSFFELLLWMNTKIPIKQLSILNERTNKDIAPFIAAFLNFISKIDSNKKCIQNSFPLPDELTNIIIDYTLPIRSYNQTKLFLNIFKNNKASEWSEIQSIAMDKLVDINNPDVAIVGVKYEDNLNDSIKKMITNIYVKPTRKGGVVQYVKYKNKRITTALKWTIICGVITIGGVIIWKRYKKY